MILTCSSFQFRKFYKNSIFTFHDNFQFNDRGWRFAVKIETISFEQTTKDHFYLIHGKVLTNAIPKHITHDHLFHYNMIFGLVENITQLYTGTPFNQRILLVGYHSRIIFHSSSWKLLDVSISTLA